MSHRPRVEDHRNDDLRRASPTLWIVPMIRSDVVRNAVGSFGMIFSGKISVLVQYLCLYFVRRSLYIVCLVWLDVRRSSLGTLESDHISQTRATLKQTNVSSHGAELSIIIRLV